MTYAIPVLLILLILGLMALAFAVVSRQSATSEGKKTPFAEDDNTPLWATDEGSSKDV